MSNRFDITTVNGRVTFNKKRDSTIAFVPYAIDGLPIGVLYTHTLQTTGSVGKRIFTLESGSLASGLTLGKLSGTIAGTPNVLNLVMATIKVSDALGSDEITLIFDTAVFLEEDSFEHGLGWPQTISESLINPILDFNLAEFSILDSFDNTDFWP